jgi:hypothetical protein
LGTGQTYGDKDSFAYQGSGGAGESGGRGGGIIWIHTSQHLNVDGIIEAKGSDSSTSQQSTYGSGGGSGGAISITTAFINGTAKSLFTVDGGRGKRGGGGGGGGWIYAYVLNSTSSDTFKPEQTQFWNGNLSVSFGSTVGTKILADRDVHDGQISHPE